MAGKRKSQRSMKRSFAAQLSQPLFGKLKSKQTIGALSSAQFYGVVSKL